jgi:arylsulfatase A-like enzyme
MSRKVVIVVWDACRPDFITPQETPTLARLVAAGVQYTRAYTVFPSETRVATASFATGAYPEVHGITANRIYRPDVDSAAPLNTGAREDLQRIEAAASGRLLDAPTLGQAIVRAGGTFLVASAGSTGNAYLLGHGSSGPGSRTVNWGFVLPESEQERLRGWYGPAPAAAVPNTAVCDYIFKLFCEELLPALRAPGPAAAVLWLSDPDHTMHAAGMGSPEARRALQENDARLGMLLERLAQLGLAVDGGQDRGCDLIIASDHGFSTIRRGEPPEAVLRETGLVEGIDYVAAAGGIWLAAHAHHALAEIVRLLQACPSCGNVLVRPGANGEVPPGAFSLDVVCAAHPRAASIRYSPPWDHAANQYGVPGQVFVRSANAGTHGSLSPYDMRITLVLSGPSFKRSLICAVPAGIVDIAPTALHLLGLQPIGQGRVLAEALTGGPDPTALPVHEERLRAEATFDSMHYSQELRRRRVGRHIYLEAGEARR